MVCETNYMCLFRIFLLLSNTCVVPQFRPLKYSYLHYYLNKFSSIFVHKYEHAFFGWKQFVTYL
jgi:hypothetical protein